MDDLSKKLNAYINGLMLLNHLMYANNLVIFTPYIGGLQVLLKICSEYGIEFHMKYNATKSTVMIIRSKHNKNTVFHSFVLNGAALLISVEVKYLGHFMTDNFRDDIHVYINRQCRKSYAQGNTDQTISYVYTRC